MEEQKKKKTTIVYLIMIVCLIVIAVIVVYRDQIMTPVKDYLATQKIQKKEKYNRQKTEEYVQYLESNGFAINQEVTNFDELLKILIVSKDPVVIEVLTKALETKDPAIRGEAAWALGELQATEAIEPLIATLNAIDQSVREKTARALGMLKDARAVEPLIAALKSDVIPPDRNVRENIVWALGELMDPKAIVPLINVLTNDSDQVVGDEAAKALGKIKDPEILSYLDAKSYYEPNIKMRIAFALGELGIPGAVQPLVNLLHDHDADVQEKATQALTRFKGDLTIFEALKSNLANQDHAIRRDSAKALGVIGYSEAIPLLISTMGDQNIFVRGVAAQALAQINEAETVDLLIIALKDRDSNVRMNAVWALGEINVAKEIEPIIAALEDREADVRKEAAGALGKIGDKKAIKALSDNLVDWDSNESVIKALVKLGWEPSESDVTQVHAWVAQRDKETLLDNWELTKKILLRDVESRDSRTIQNALFAFIGIGKSEITADLIRTLDRKGNKTMAEAYLNCGKKELTEAAEKWASDHGYTVTQWFNVPSPVNWGSMK